MKSRIGLALGGGGARGIAHLGVWQRLMELGVELHCIAGTSIGAIAGAAWHKAFRPRGAKARVWAKRVSDHICDQVFLGMNGSMQ